MVWKHLKFSKSTFCRSQKPANCSSFCTELQIRPYKKEMEMAEIKDVPILDFIAEEVRNEWIFPGTFLEVLPSQKVYENWQFL